MQKKMRLKILHLQPEKINIVQIYTYLGTWISSSGNFTLSLDHLLKKAPLPMPSLVWDDALISKVWNLHLHMHAKFSTPWSHQCEV